MGDERRKLTSLRAYLVAGATLVVGSVLLLAAVHSSSDQTQVWGVFLAQVGSAIIIVAAVGILWELRLRRSLIEEVASDFRFGGHIHKMGVRGAHMDFDGIAWASKLSKAKRIRIYFARGTTWRNRFEGKLRKLAEREDVSVEVLLPDPQTDAIVQSLAFRFGSTQDVVRTEIQNSMRAWEELFRGGKATFSAKYVQKEPLFSFYLIDDEAILALYRHQEGRGEIIVFECESSGQMYQYLEAEFDSIQKPSS